MMCHRALSIDSILPSLPYQYLQICMIASVLVSVLKSSTQETQYNSKAHGGSVSAIQESVCFGLHMLNGVYWEKNERHQVGV
jgi:hypothetical protein